MNKIKNKFQVITYNNRYITVYNSKSKITVSQSLSLLQTKPTMFILIVANVYE
jgi:hypothetical protein